MPSQVAMSDSTKPTYDRHSSISRARVLERERQRLHRCRPRPAGLLGVCERHNKKALDELQDAIHAWMEAARAARNPIPAPSAPATDHRHSGKVLLRMPRRLHAQLAQSAKQEDVSLNQYIVYVLSSAVGSRRLRAIHSAQALYLERRIVHDARGHPPRPTPPCSLASRRASSRCSALERRAATPRLEARGTCRAPPGTRPRPTARRTAHGSAGRSPAPRAGPARASPGERSPGSWSTCRRRRPRPAPPG